MAHIHQLRIPVTSTPATRTIDCSECSMFESEHCADCVVTFLCDSAPGEHAPAVVFDLDELRAVKLLADAGLVPTLRHSATG